MGFRLEDLPVYIMLAAVVGFFVYVIIQSSRQDKRGQDKEPTKK